MGLCAHHIPTPWAKRWDIWLASTVTSFAMLEGAALITEGAPATLTAHIRRLAGLNPRCRHALVGRLAILIALTWAALHLGWGILGWDGRKHKWTPQ